MSALIPFTFEGVAVCVIELDGEPWFVGKDVAEVLGYASPQKAVRDHCKNGLPIKQATKQGARGENDSFIPELDAQTIIIPERDLYRLIMRSKLPAAERSEEWVVAEVLPSIRKTGRYDTGDSRKEVSVGFQMMCEALQSRRAVHGKENRI